MSSSVQRIDAENSNQSGSSNLLGMNAEAKLSSRAPVLSSKDTALAGVLGERSAPIVPLKSSESSTAKAPPQKRSKKEKVADALDDSKSSPMDIVHSSALSSKEVVPESVSGAMPTPIEPPKSSESGASKPPPQKRPKKEKAAANASDDSKSSPAAPAAAESSPTKTDAATTTPTPTPKSTPKPRKKPSPKPKESPDAAATTDAASGAENNSPNSKGKSESSAATPTGADDKTPVVITPAQKKRLALLEEQLKEEQVKQAEVKNKLDALSRKMNTVRWPVKDSLVLPKLLAIESKKPAKEQKSGPADLQKPIPPPTVVIPLEDQSLVSDVLACWDFMNLFTKQLELARMSLDEFIDLMQYRGQDSIAFVELFMAPLRVLVCDEKLCAQLSLDIPFETNFARKMTAAELQVGPLGSLGRGVSRSASLPSLSAVGMDIDGDNEPVSSVSVGPLSLTQALVDEHRLYSKPVSLLPRRLRHDQVDPLRWQAVCSAVLPYLPPVRAFLKLSLELQHLITDPAVIRANNALTNNSTLSGNEMSTTSQRQREKEAKKIKDELLAAQMRIRQGIVDVSGVEQVSNLLVQSNISHRNRDINIDSALCITSDVTESLKVLRDAMTALHAGDLYKATIRSKVFILKMLFKACYATGVFVDAVEEKAELLVQKTEERKRDMWNSIKDKRAGSKSVQERAIELCRVENKAAAEEKEKANAEKAAKAAQKAARAEEKKKTETSVVGGSGGGGGEDSKSPKKKGVKRAADGDEKVKENEANTTGGGAASAATGKSKKVIKGKEDPFAPSAQQLANKIEDLLFLEEIGIDDVHELGDDTVSDDEEQEMVEVDGMQVVLSGGRQRGAASRSAAAEREDKRKKVLYHNEQRAAAKENLIQAIDSARESDLRRAIKQGQRGELLQWEEEDGKVFCTPMMHQAQKMLASIEARIKSEKADAEFQRSMKEYQVRTEPLGCDRHGNTYWAFTGDENRLYVCLSDGSAKTIGTSTGTGAGVKSPGNQSSSSSAPTQDYKKINVPHNSEAELFRKDPSLSRLFNTRPYRETGDRWQVYGSERDIYYLWAALDDRGINERALREKIRSSFDFEFTPPVEYRVDHDWVGREIERVWPKHARLKNSFGIIDGWLAEDAEEGDEALWHVQYPDGDMEELDENEVRRFLLSDEKKTQAEKEEAKNLAAAMSMARNDDRRASTRVTETALKTAVKQAAPVSSEDTESEDEDDAPNVVLTYDNKDSNRTYMHRPTKAGYFGFNGLKAEMRKFLGIIEDGLKKADVAGFTKDVKAVLRKCLESSYTVEALRDVLLSIEATVQEHASENDDVDDAVEARNEQEKEHKDMRQQGWNFDADASPLIGRSARRFFLRTGASDGVITGIHRSEDSRTNTVEEAFLLEHADGDVEEVDEAGVRMAIRAFELNQMSDVTAASREELDEDGDDSDDEDDEGYDDRDLEDMNEELNEQQLKMWTIEAEEDPDVACISHLWPTAGVRKHWLQAVKSATCVADIALAMSALHAQAVSFGVTGESPFELAKERSPHEIFKKPKLKRDNKSHSKKGKKSSKASAEEENQNARPSRKASRNANYAE